MDDTPPTPPSDEAAASGLAAEFAADADPAASDAPLVDLDAVPEGHRSGYVALIGPPNVGKSTLMNRLVGTKLSIVTPKPSTTRHRVLGILTRPGSQIVFLDTPGVVKPQYRLHDLMMQDVTRAVHDADVLLFMHDATREHVHTHALDRLMDRPAILVLNKMDKIDHAQALPLVEQYTAARAFDAIVPISAQNGFNLDALLGEVTQRLPEGPPFYPADQLSEHPERFFVAEIVREAIFNQFRQEIPYSTQVNVVSYQEREGQKDFVDCEIVVERDTQKGILIGKGGSALKRIGAAAREQIEAFTGRPVYLQLHVKARADWRNREGMLKSYGYGG